MDRSAADKRQRPPSHRSGSPIMSGHSENPAGEAVPEDGSLSVSGKSARVGSSPDVRHGLPPETVQRVADAERRADPDQKQVPDDAYRAAMTSPLLLIYLLEGTEHPPGPKGVKRPAYRDGLVLPALGLHFPGTRDPDAPKHLVKYRLNRVAQKELLPPDIEEESAEDDIDADD